jgi:DNA topoisomerase IA
MTKPSSSPAVANDIAKTLGGFTKHDEYFESDEYVLSSAVGHLLEIAVPEHDVKRQMEFCPPADDSDSCSRSTPSQDGSAAQGTEQADQA